MTAPDWINKALEDAARQSWAKMIDLEDARFDLEAWAEDGMFKSEQQVRIRLCQYANGMIAQIGKANFRCTLD